MYIGLVNKMYFFVLSIGLHDSVLKVSYTNLGFLVHRLGQQDTSVDWDVCDCTGFLKEIFSKIGCAA